MHCMIAASREMSDEPEFAKKCLFFITFVEKGRIYMAFTLDTYSKSCSSDELQTWIRSFREVFAGKDTHIFIGEANTGKLADADYIVAICNKIKNTLNATVNSPNVKGKYKLNV